MDTIKISSITTTHIRFSSEIKYVDLSNKVLAAKIVEGSRDIIALKAKEPFAPNAQTKMVFSFDKISVLQGQVFRAYLYESGGTRNYVITFSEKQKSQVLG